ncbi:threonine--tRNA ligase [Patescibacteria group bacterium]|jgi:threonyl-tRNA synthetase|nr:threonine--tRNA ligase [Patescibacteria group bacterium]
MSAPDLDHLRHTLAHLMASAVLKKYPHAKPTLGPPIENGFYYDFDFSQDADSSGTDAEAMQNGAPGEADLKEIQKLMKKELSQWTEFTHKEVTPEEARALFKDNPYKLEMIDELAETGEPITLYTCGGFTDLCRGGHLGAPHKEIDPDAFTLDRIAGAYWRGDESNAMLTRIYGLAFASKDELDAFLTQREEARKRDHKKLGKELDLFVIDEKVGKGLPMWTPKGTAMKFELENLTRELERAYGYQHVETPYLGSEELYRTSGHLDHYSANMYAPIDMDGEKYYLRPMACPHHIRMFQRASWSYRDLPVRYAEIADYNRFEKSGELMGMIRVRKFQLTDAHIFVAPEGLKEEFKSVCTMIAEGMRALGIAEIVSYRFSKRDPHNKEKYFPDDALWEKAEETMKQALDELGFAYVEAEDEAAFYGPKLDVQAKNVNGKEDTLFTAQMDFLLPEKFDIEYVDADGQRKRPVMIHRSTIGSLERVFGFLIEHYAGAFPLWLSPEQVRVIPITDTHRAYAQDVCQQLRDADIRAELDTSDDSLGKKIRAAKTQKVPYFLVIGDQEVTSKEVKVEQRDGGSETLPTPALIERLSQEIKERR